MNDDDLLRAHWYDLHRWYWFVWLPAQTGKGTGHEPLTFEQAFELGWRTAANWIERDDLVADIGSPAYIKDRDAALKRA